MLTLKEFYFINIIKSVTEKRGKAFSQETINFMCNAFNMRTYQVCFELYRTGYNFCVKEMHSWKDLNSNSI